MWARLIANCLRSAGAALTEYRDPLGVKELRQAIVDHLRPTRGIMVDAEQVIIVGGSQGGLNLACRLLVTLGSSAFVESPCYQGAAYLFESFGAKLHPVHVDDNGIDVSKLPATQNAICYVTPSHQFPLGVTLSLDRRLELLAWATRTNSYIIEDDYDSDIRYRGAPIAALKALDRCERVIYVGTFSKSMGAGLRIGYVVMPATLFDAARHIKTLTNNGQPWLPQAALADFITNGSYDRHLRRIRHSYQARRETLLAALQKHFGGSTIVGDNAGMHLVWRMPDQLPPANVVEKIALKAGVGVYTLNSGGAVDFGVMRDSDRYLVLGFTAPSEREISIGISRLAAAQSAPLWPGQLTAGKRNRLKRPRSIEPIGDLRTKCCVTRRRVFTGADPVIGGCIIAFRIARKEIDATHTFGFVCRHDGVGKRVAQREFPLMPGEIDHIVFEGQALWPRTVRVEQASKAFTTCHHGFVVLLDVFD